MCSTCFYCKRDVRSIRHYVDLNSAKLLATALVSSHLDYCNSLSYGNSDTDLTELQCIQNQLACLVTKSPLFICSVPLHCSLHWLPVRFRILFKINLLTNETLREKELFYLHSILGTPLISHSRRSNNGICQSVPRVQTNTSTRAFHSCAASLWNNLPLSVCSSISVFTFKKNLKTHLFDLAVLSWVCQMYISGHVINCFHHLSHSGPNRCPTLPLLVSGFYFRGNHAICSLD